MKKIAVLGSTGSIGTQTLDIVRNNRDEYRIVGLSCGSSVEELAKQAIEFDCLTVGVADESKREQLRALLPNANVFCGVDALTQVMSDADVVVVAVVGMIGLKAVLAALEASKTVALANKESLVAGGAAVTAALKRGGRILPVDSEHSAVWQCLQGEKAFKRIILTASGGPFYFTPTDELASVTPERAVAHPNWRMGKKISVDSATMMNKGLEIIAVVVRHVKYRLRHTPRKRGPFHGRVCRRVDKGAGVRARYAHADTIRIVLSRACGKRIQAVELSVGFEVFAARRNAVSRAEARSTGNRVRRHGSYRVERSQRSGCSTVFGTQNIVHGYCKNRRASAQRGEL